MAERVASVKIQIEGANQAVSELNKYAQSLGKVSQAQEQAAKGTGKLNFSGFQNGLNSLSGTFSKLSQHLGGMVPQLNAVSGGLNGAQGAFAALNPAVIAGAAALATFAVSLKGAYELGMRGAQLQPIVNAFGNLASEFGNSTQILNTLKAQTGGTISDLQLMKTATFAFSGASKELGGVLAQDLGNVLQNTRTLAIALGRDPAEAQGRFIEAIKKNERELLDELGIIVSADKAYKDYAKSINKSASALTDQEKNTAFAIAAISQLDERVSKLGTQDQTLANLQKPFVALRNILDKLALAFQPIFSAFASGFATLFSGIEAAAAPFISIFASFSKVVGAIFTAMQAISGFVGSLISVSPAFALASSAANYFAATISIIADVASSVAGMVGKVFSRMGAVLEALGLKVNTQTQGMVDSLAGRLATGGGKIIGAFAAGLLRGGTLVVDAVTAIAQIVADFLQGFSPPKMGPLSRIDEGGKNIIEAWAKGFADANLSPVDELASNINTQLGEIGNYSLEQVKTRLSALDQAILPFNQQLDLAKASFEEIAGFADAGLKAVERQLKTALAQQGINGEQVRELDKQAQMLKQLKQERQGEVDNAELQLSLAKAQQARERALLSIQEKRAKVEGVGVVGGGGGGGAAEKTPTEKAATEKAGKTGKGAGEALAEGVADGFSGGAAPDLLNSEAINNAKKVLTDGFKAGLEDSGYGAALADFQGSTGKLQTQLSRIAEANPAAKIVEKFKGIENTIAKPFQTAKTAIQGVVNEITSIVGGLASTFAPTFAALNMLASTLGTALAPLGSAMESAFGSLAQGMISNFLLQFQLLGGAVVALKNNFASLAGSVQTALASVTALLSPFAETFNTTFIAPLTLALNSVFGADGLLGLGFVLNMQSIFGEGGLIPTAILSLNTSLQMLMQNSSMVSNGISNSFNRIAGGIARASTSIQATINSLQGTLTTFASDLGLGQVANTLKTKLVDAFVAAVNSVINALNSAINSVIDPFLGIPGVGDALRGLGLPVSIQPLSVPANAKGGIGVKGLRLVGENGPELIAPKNPVNIFPSALSRAILAQGSSSFLQGAMPSSYTNNNTTNVNNTFNVGSENQALLLQRQQQAFLGY